MEEALAWWASVGLEARLPFALPFAALEVLEAHLLVVSRVPELAAGLAWEEEELRVCSRWEVSHQKEIQRQVVAEKLAMKRSEVEEGKKGR